MELHTAVELLSQINPTQNALGSQSSLTEWSMSHIKHIFETPEDGDALLAIQATFSDHLTATLNGNPLSRQGIDQLVLAMRRNSKLRVKWKKAEPMPNDSTNRDGSFHGTYIVSGIKKEVYGQELFYERHKTVRVKIESMSPDPYTDSRRIAELDFEGRDVLMLESQY